MTRVRCSALNGVPVEVLTIDDTDPRSVRVRMVAERRRSEHLYCVGLPIEIVDPGRTIRGLVRRFAATWEHSYDNERLLDFIIDTHSADELGDIGGDMDRRSRREKIKELILPTPTQEQARLSALAEEVLDLGATGAELSDLIAAWRGNPPEHRQRVLNLLDNLLGKAADSAAALLRAAAKDDC